MEGEKDPESFRKIVRSQTKYHFLKKQEKYNQVIWEGSRLKGVWEEQEKHRTVKGWMSYPVFCRMLGWIQTSATNSCHLLINGLGEHLHTWSSGQTTTAGLFLVSAHRSTTERDGCSATVTHVVTKPGRTFTQ